MDQHQEQNALEKLRLAEKTTHLKGASDWFDLLDAEKKNLTQADRYDAAFEFFSVFKAWMIDWEIASSLRVSGEEFAAVWLRTVPHLTEEVACDLLAERFAEDAQLKLPNGFHVNWHPANGEAVIAGPGVTLVIGKPLAALIAERAL